MNSFLSAADGVPRDAGDIVTWFNRLIRWHPDVLREASEQYERQILHNIQTILGHGDSRAVNEERTQKEDG